MLIYNFSLHNSMKEGSHWKLLLYGLFFVVLFIGLIRIFGGSTGIFFYLELLGLLVLLLTMLIGFLGYGETWSDMIFLIVFLAYIANLLLVWGFRSSHGALLSISIVAFLVTLSFVLSGRGSSEEEDFVPEEPHSMVFDAPQVEVVDIEPAKESTTRHSPGRLIASKTSNVYHAPKCEWAKRISKAKRVWFEDKAEAWEKGYKAHSCME
jgi:hypothetical protein